MPQYTYQAAAGPPEQRLLLALNAADLAARYEIAIEEEGGPPWATLTPAERERLLTAAGQALDDPALGDWLDAALDQALKDARQPAAGRAAPALPPPEEQPESPPARPLAPPPPAELLPTADSQRKNRQPPLLPPPPARGTDPEPAVSLSSLPALDPRLRLSPPG